MVSESVLGGECLRGLYLGLNFDLEIFIDFDKK